MDIGGSSSVHKPHSILSQGKAFPKEMAESSSRNLTVEKVIFLSDELIKVLQNSPDDSNNVSQFLERSHSLSSTCDSDLNQVRSLCQDYQNKIESYKQKIEEAKSETAADAELDLLQRRLNEELEKERLLKEEFRAISNEFNDLEQQRISVLEQKKNLQKIEQENLRTQYSIYEKKTKIVCSLNLNHRYCGKR